MELVDVYRPNATHILTAANEMCHTILLGQSTPKISISIKNKGQTRQNGFNLLCLKVTCNEPVPFIKLFEENCLPQLCEIICQMQTQEKESHLAFQTVDESNYRLRKTMLLWLESKTGTSSVTVNILNETVTEIKDGCHISAILEIRVFMPASDIIHFSKGMLDLLERIKFLNPQVQLSFSLYSLTSVEVDLCSTSSISCEAFDIYSGHDLFLRKNTTQFTVQTLKVKCSKSFPLRFQGKDMLMETASLICISCFVPIWTVQKHIPYDGDCDNYLGTRQENTGQVRVYGPANLPFDMKTVTKKLTLSPDSLLLWQKFGFQVKKSFSCSSYDLHCSARITNKDAVPSWAFQCQHFSLMIAFILNKKEESTDDTSIMYKHQELFQQLEQEVLSSEMYCTFQEAAYTCLSDLLLLDKPETAELQPKTLHTHYEGTKSELFKKMIPDVVNSLTDIFIRSTCVDFRLKVGALVPVIDNVEELQLDNWDISQDSLYVVEEGRNMSPDSLDFEWQSSDTKTLCQDEPTIEYTNPLSCEKKEDTCSVEIYPDVIDDKISNNCLPTASPSWSLQCDNLLNAENELELWQLSNDSLTSVDFNTCSMNSNTTKTSFSPVAPKNIDLKSLHSAQFSTDNPASTLKYIPEDISVSQYIKSQTHENLLDNNNKQSLPEDSEKMPRKRSSEYIDDNVSVENCHVTNSINASKQDSHCDSKKQRFQNSDLISDINLSSNKFLEATVFSEELDRDLILKSEFKHCDQDEDTFSGCWFHEADIANWCAELDK